MNRANDASKATTYELPLEDAELPPATRAAEVERRSLPGPILAENVLWYCQLRWLVVAVLGGGGLVAAWPGVAERYDMTMWFQWPLWAAGILAVGNACFLWYARRRRTATSAASAERVLWSQICMDLLVLTVVVHFVGSVGTFMPFAYLFHVVLACVFFSRTQALAVTLLACVLYAGCITIERTGLIATGGMFGGRMPAGGAPSRAAIVNVVMAPVFWLVVWYLVSKLSALVRQRDAELERTNQQLVAAQEERARHMLNTTHQLKAPFAAIHANAQLLQKGYCGQLPEQALEVVGRIAARCRRLAREIQDMLQLANLNSTGKGPLPVEQTDVADALQWAIAQIRPIATERSITIDVDIEPAVVAGVVEHLKMLLVNLISNAVTYSHSGGRVRVRCRRGNDGHAAVAIEDDGIGIPAEKLPRIFDEYYRTGEAVRHNRESTGLGLAIVKRVARNSGITIRVTSQADVGTSFHLRVPAKAPPGAGEAKIRSPQDVAGAAT